MDPSSRKLKYHLRSKQVSIDKSNQQILTSSPILHPKRVDFSLKLPDYLKIRKKFSCK